MTALGARNSALIGGRTTCIITCIDRWRTRQELERLS